MFARQEIEPSSKSDGYIKNHEQIWDAHKRKDRSDASPLIAVIEKFCSQSNNPYTSKLNGICQQHKHSQICYILFSIAMDIPLNEISCDTELAAIFQVIQNRTGLNIHDFNAGGKFYSVFHKITQHKFQGNLENDIFANAKEILESDNTEIIKILLDEKLLDEETIGLTIVHCTLPFEDIGSITKVFYQYVSLDDDEPNRDGFKYAILDKRYKAAAFNFCNVHGLKLPDSISNVENFPSMFETICDAIRNHDDKIENSWMHILIDQMAMLKTTFEKSAWYMEILDPDICYEHLCSLKNSIQNWQELSDSYLKIFPANLSNIGMFCDAMKNPNVAKQLLSNAYIKDYEQIWNTHKSENQSDAGPLIAVIEKYCSQSNNPYTHELHGVLWYRKTQIYYMLFEIAALPLKKIRCDTELAAMLQVIQNGTGLNIHDFSEGGKYYLFFRNRRFKSYGNLVFDLFANLEESDNTGIIKILLDDKLLSEKDIRTSILQDELPYREIDSILKNSYHYVSLNDDEKNREAFICAIKSKRYKVAVFIFCNVNGLKLPESLSNVENFTSMFETICEAIANHEDKIENSWMHILIDKIEKLKLSRGSLVRDTLDPEICYVHLCSLKNSIQNWQEVSDSYLKIFPGGLNPPRMFCHAIKKISPLIADQLLSNEDTDFGKSIIVHNSQTIEALNEVLNSEQNLSSALLEILKLFPLNDSHYQEMGLGNDNVISYFKWRAENAWKKSEYELILNKLNKHHCFNKFFPFFAGNAQMDRREEDSDLPTLPKDVHREIANYMIKLF